jgi:hypothetical protein
MGSSARVVRSHRFDPVETGKLFQSQFPPEFKLNARGWHFIRWVPSTQTEEFDFEFEAHPDLGGWCNGDVTTVIRAAGPIRYNPGDRVPREMR